jgi:hypothetical protein
MFRACSRGRYKRNAEGAPRIVFVMQSPGRGHQHESRFTLTDEPAPYRFKRIGVG